MTAVPFCTADSEPGDAVIFDLHTWHASRGGRNRLAWTVGYLAVPGDCQGRRRRLSRYAGDHHDQTGHGFDRHQHPFWRDWIAWPRLTRGGWSPSPGCANAVCCTCLAPSSAMSPPSRERPPTAPAEDGVSPPQPP
jgi:hypothetical protein